ncbi:MAG: DNA topoisomerase IV subunit A [Acidobacteriota bacterium]|nr:DNA topoisomerase IV subunit A [Acidobacteriota bacterium]
MGEDLLKELIDDNFLEYASYVIKDRAIPHIDDGLKPVQRRILHTMNEMEDGKYNKVANVVGRSMQYHPHGDASIYSALVVVANKDYFIDKQGNFGNIYTGDVASAPRYIECRLTPLAREVMFNKEITEFVPSYDGRNQEPVTLPAKVPVLLMQGAEGIAVGMATQILPHNFNELLQAQIAILNGGTPQVYPDFQTGGMIDVTQYNDGNGKVKVRARVEIKDNKHLIITDIPYGTTTEKLIASIEAAAKRNRIKISSIQDYTAEKVEIELALPRGVQALQVEEALYAFTDCEITHNLNLIVIGQDNKPHQLSVLDVLRHNTQKLMDDLRREYEIELGKLQDNLHYKTLEQIFIEERIYKNIEEQVTYEKVFEAVYAGFEPFKDRLIRELTDEDVERLLQIRIKRISRFDINKSRQQIQEILDRIDKVNSYLRNMKRTTTNYIKALLKKYGKGHERRTVIQEFETVNRHKVAVQDLKLCYDEESGYMGTSVKTREPVPCSQFDKVLIFTPDFYMVIPVPEKLYIKEKILWWGKIDKKQVYNCIYREQTTGMAYMKRFKVDKFIMERQYPYTQDNCKVLLMEAGEAPKFRAYYPKTGRIRVTMEDFDMNELLVKGAQAKGNRVSSKPVNRIRVLEEKKKPENGAE